MSLIEAGLVVTDSLNEESLEYLETVDSQDYVYILEGDSSCPYSLDVSLYPVKPEELAVCSEYITTSDEALSKMLLDSGEWELGKACWSNEYYLVPTI